MTEQDVEIPASGFFPSASTRALEAHADWLQPWAAGPDGTVKIVDPGAVHRVGGRAGSSSTPVSGNGRSPSTFAGMSDDGSFLGALADAGFAREDVDVVVCTHLHFDHVGWNTMWDGDRWVPTFPNARYVLARDRVRALARRDARRPGPRRRR